METVASLVSPEQELVVRAAGPASGKRLGKLFYIFAALQLVVLLMGAVVGLYMAPISLFVAQTKAQAIGWLLIGGWALLSGVLAIILSPLAIIAGSGIGQGKRWGRTFGVGTAIIALAEFPLGTAFGIYALKKLVGKREDYYQ